jgi:hypothetical protein
VVTVQVPWAEPHGRFTLMFEAFAVTVIEAARSFVRAIEILKVDWHTIQEIVRRAVERGSLRRSTEAVMHVGMDEKSFGRGQDYVSVMTDLSGRRVLDVVEGRDTASALELWKRLPAWRRTACSKVEGVSTIREERSAYPCGREPSDCGASLSESGFRCHGVPVGYRRKKRCPCILVRGQIEPSNRLRRFIVG